MTYTNEGESHLAQLITEDLEGLYLTRLRHGDFPVLIREARLPLHENREVLDAMRKTDEMIGCHLGAVDRLV